MIISYPQVEAFNHFCRFQLRKKIEQFELTLNDYIITLRGAVMERYPMTEKNTKKTVRGVLGMETKHFDVTVYADVHILARGSNEVLSITKKVELFKLPVLTGSIFDATEETNPGYFIVNGAEHMPIMQERLTHNKLIKTSTSRIEVSCKNPNKSNVIAVRLSLDDRKCVYWYDTNIIKKEKKNVIPIAYILLLLGFNGYKDDYMLQSFQDVEEATINAAVLFVYDHVVLFKDASLDADAKKEQVMQLIKNRFLIHITDIPDKLTYLLLMMEQLHHGKVDNRDHLMFKSFAACNTYLDELINHYFIDGCKNRISKELNMKEKTTLKQVIPMIPKLFLDNSISSILRSLIATGNGLGGATGLTQSVSRVNYMSYFSCTRKLAVKQKDKVKITSMRLIDESYRNKICSAETPDGKSIGLIKHMTILAEVSRYHEVNLGKMDDSLKGDMLLLIHGVPVPGRFNKDAIVNRFITRRRLAYINRSVNYRVHKNYIEIINTEGRLITPLRDEYGCIVYVDANEDTSTYTEVDDTAQYGYSASLIPFAHHNQAARNTFYAAQMLKQTISAITNYYFFVEKKKQQHHFLKPYSSFYALSYPQHPLAYTKTQKLLDNHENGTLIITCCKTHPFAQEDSVVLSQGPIDRGELRSFSYTTYSHVVNPHSIHPSDWAKVEARGIIPDGSVYYDARLHQTYQKPKLIHVEVGAKVVSGDVVVLPNYRLPRTSIKGVVQQVISNLLDEGNVQIIITIRHEHVPKIGDKFSSQHAQKGTVSDIIPECDMPYSMVTGMRAEMIVSPHAFPSRQTFGHQMVGLASKVSCITGKPVDATAFTKSDAPGLNNELFPLMEKEWMIDGESGKLIEEPCYMEPIYYHILKHHSENKGCARADGPVDKITRQPVSGRGHEGGMKNGEMETHALIAHGASGFVEERTIISSDNVSFYICHKCGRRVNNENTPCYCDNYLYTNVTGRYATKVLFDELQAFNIDVQYGKRDF